MIRSDTKSLLGAMIYNYNVLAMEITTHSGSIESLKQCPIRENCTHTSTGLQTLPVPTLLTFADPALVAHGVGPLSIDASMAKVIAA